MQPDAPPAARLDTADPAIRRLSVKLLADLLHDEIDNARAAGIAQDLVALRGELLEGDDYTASAAAAEVLAEELVRKPGRCDSCRAALDLLASSSVFQHALRRSSELEERARPALPRIGRALASSVADGTIAASAVPAGDGPRGLPYPPDSGDCAPKEEGIAISDLDAVREHLRLVVTTDPLTRTLRGNGLRQALQAELRQTSRTGAHPAAILLDCDNFQQINLRWGRAVGDSILTELAGRIRAEVRSSDHVARVGADEFLMLLPETGYWEALQIADRLLTKVSAPLELGVADPLQVTMSVGVCMIPSVATSFEQVLELARAALVKTRAGKRVIDENDPASKTVDERVADLLVLSQTYRAVREPIVRLADGRVTGYELLARTTIPGFEMPGDFLQMAFSRRILPVVDRLCLKACLAEAASGPDSSLDLYVNLFPSTILTTPPKRLLEMFSGVPHDRLCVEVTEQQFFFGDGRELKQRLAVLRQAGVRIALDDVGFSRTFLELLILLEPDVVKIDRRFVQGVSTDPLQAGAFRRLVEAIDALGAVIVAEGIETPDDRRTIQQFGVPYGQGFLWPDDDAAACHDHDITPSSTIAGTSIAHTRPLGGAAGRRISCGAARRSSGRSLRRPPRGSRSR